MNLFKLTWKNITGSAFRSGAVFLCAALVAGLAISATLVVRGADQSLRQSLSRLGADLVVVPWGTMSDLDTEDARLMAVINDDWMPLTYVNKIDDVKGVEAVAPQLYLATLENPEFYPGAKAFLLAFDPANDFTLQPWLDDLRLESGLQMNDAIVGSALQLEVGQEVMLLDRPLRVKARLASTGSSIDSSIFVSFETGLDLARVEQTYPSPRVNVAEGGISAVLVKVGGGRQPHAVALDILHEVPGVVPLESAALFQSERAQMQSLLRTVLGLVTVICLLALLFVGLVFSLAANERRQEIGVLRALGATRDFVFQSLMLEGGLLAVLGGGLGVLIATAAFGQFGTGIAAAMGLPWAPARPEVWWLVLLTASGLALSILTITIAAAVPAWKISREEAAIAMRE